jgi:hypothetical protein
MSATMSATKCREVRGPGVAGFGIIGKSYTGPVDKILLDHRAVADAARLQDEIAAANAKIAHKVLSLIRTYLNAL